MPAPESFSLGIYLAAAHIPVRKRWKLTISGEGRPENMSKIQKPVFHPIMKIFYPFQQQKNHYLFRQKKIHYLFRQRKIHYLFRRRKIYYPFRQRKIHYPFQLRHPSHPFPPQYTAAFPPFIPISKIPWKIRFAIIRNL